MIIVMSKKSAKEYSYNSNEHTSIIISINDPNNIPNQFGKKPENKIKDILPLFFEDNDNPSTSIQNDDVEKIVNFVKNYKDKVDNIIVHCGAGVSRSAGVAAAILKYYTNDDSAIFDSPRYCPNMYVYRKVLEGFFNDAPDFDS